MATPSSAVAATKPLHAGDILVLDARTSLPLAGAIISENNQSLKHTTADGIASLAQGAREGIFLSVTMEGYATLTFRFTSNAANVVRLSPLLKIGNAKASAAPRDAVVGSVITVADGTLIDAIAGRADISVVRGTGSDGQEVVAIRGQDASKTGVTIDGIRVSRPGAATDFRAIGTDLAESVTVSTLGDPASPAGNVDIKTIDAGRFPHLAISESVGGWGLEQTTIAFAETSGKFGFTLAHARRDGATQLSNVVVKDESDASYASQGQRRQYNDLGKLRYQPNAHFSFTLSDNITNTSSFYWCGEFTTTLPCGIGPNNVDTSRFSVAGFQAQYHAGGFDATLRGGRVVTLLERDFDARELFGTPEPLLVEQRIASSPQQLTLARAIGKHRLSFDVQTNDSHTDFVPKAGSSFLTESHTVSPFSNASLADAFTTQRFSSNIALSFARYDSRNAPELRARSTFNIDSDSSLAWGVAFGSATPLVNAVESFGDPLNLRVDCPGRVATSIAPADPIRGQSEQRYEISYATTHSVASTTLTAYVDREQGQPVYAYLPTSSVMLPPGFLASANAVWAHPEVCGLQPFPADRLFFNTLVSSMGKNVGGLEYQGKFPLGPAAVLSASLALVDARYSTHDARFATAQSLAYNGARIVGVPTLKARVQLVGAFHDRVPASGVRERGSQRGVALSR